MPVHALAAERALVLRGEGDLRDRSSRCALASVLVVHAGLDVDGVAVGEARVREGVDVAKVSRFAGKLVRATVRRRGLVALLVQERVAVLGKLPDECVRHGETVNEATLALR